MPFWKPFCVSLLISTLSPAATRYVATDGDDSSGDGSAANPWASINTATREADDGDLILVRPGTYTGRQRLLGGWETGITVRSEIPYRARLEANGTVVTCFTGKNITFEGFDLGHTGPGSAALVMQVQNLRDDSDPVRNITIRNNIFRDSYNNDLLKVGNGATDLTITGNLFMNQAGSDEHIDVNSTERIVIEDNIFFNDFAGSGRTDTGTSSFVLIKDSNGDDDRFLGSRNVTVRRNVMLNWVGNAGTNFILFGEDGAPYYEAFDCLAENNLLIGNSPVAMRAPFGVKGCRDITFRNNTVVGDMVSNAFAMRLNREGANLQLNNIQLFNNIWSDPTGTMNDFSDTPPDDTTSFTLDNNLYWNGGQAIPENTNLDLINSSDDANAIIDDPLLGAQDEVILPRWVPEENRFAEGSSTIREAFVRLVEFYGRPANGSPAANAANASNTPAEDILGNPRTTMPDIGAFEIQPTITTTYEAWIAARHPGITDPAIIGFTADPDGDGRTNGVEYAVGEVTFTPNVFTVVRRTSDPALEVIPQTSTDLISWDTPLTPDDTTPVGDAFEQITFTLPEFPRSFFRIRVEL